ncbi:MAG: hypothetical protein CMM29_07375 [Rhodospirillaceae bacterium]|nr:hypothetical protein [Rhodospirillaceae bacterium]
MKVTNLETLEEELRELLSAFKNHEEYYRGVSEDAKKTFVTAEGHHSAFKIAGLMLENKITKLFGEENDNSKY